ncbi:MAG: TlpA family protein disulfide reductase [Bryobacterales bacterium]|nr:TlpA family protein disulfide reductase [Bryobacterales bacterium]
MRRLPLLLVCASALAAQSQLPPEEQQALSGSLAEAGNSSHEFIFALENHLKKYPQTKSRWELERALVKAAKETGDDARIVKWGEAVLARESEDLQTLELVTRSLVRGVDKASAEKALASGKKWEQVLRTLEPRDATEKIRWQTRMDLDQGMSRALQAQAKALLILGKHAEAEALAAKSFAAYPFDESARVLAQAREAQSKFEPAVDAWADAFVSSDGKQPSDLEAMRAAWKKAKADAPGAGERLLAAHDRFNQWNDAKIARLRQYDANALKGKPAEFVVTSVTGEKLALASLRGKVVVLDFWATWCGPCRTQHPLYERVKEKFQDREDVAFVYLNTDEDKALVAPFLEANRWSKNVYFEEGLSRLLNVTSIPTTVILNKRGEIASRMNGFLPEKFVDMLTERVQRILSE